MTYREIRQQFFDFFTAKNHQLVASASVVPQGDATLLFTNAGMNQFKDIFLGVSEPKHPRIVDTQKCIRVSGKHNDLEEVGIDTYHHTFFEMLGNWSFGDYYKKEAIAWAWELLTEVWKLPKNKLYATVYRTDEEAKELWKNQTDIDRKHILDFDEKDNFWEMGETGPCGPCSEIHYDLGEGHCDCLQTSNKCGVNQCDRYIEIWNLVFIQYNRLPNGELEELSSKYVDTGMGFERLVSVLQEKKSNYDTDIFSPLIDFISKLSSQVAKKNHQKKEINLSDQIAKRVIADHIRAIAFSIADGVTPSNEGRGYVIRRILRRACRYGRNLGLKEPFLYKLTEVLKEQLGDIFPEIVEKEKYLRKIIFSEEEIFNKTLDRGLKRLEDIFSRNEEQQVIDAQMDGKVAFELYDTYGFPLDLTSLIAGEKGFRVDEAGFAIEMEAQRKRSKKEKKDDDLFYLTKALSKLDKKTKYYGDEKTEGEGRLLLIINNNQSVDSLIEGKEGILVFDDTPFYGESGGQIGDAGIISEGSLSAEGYSSFKVTTTKKLEGFHLHYGQVMKGAFGTKKKYQLSILTENRFNTRKNHSATHLLQASLREVLGSHVKQAGSLVTPEKLRFDFNHFNSLTKEEIEKIERRVNEAIWKNYPVHITEMTMKKAIARGAIAFFEEKYGEVVRVVDMKENAVESFSLAEGSHSIELCGGSHVRTTGEIGVFKISMESSVAAGIRRIEATTGEHAYNLSKKEKNLLEQIQKIISTDNLNSLEKIKSLVEDNKRLIKENISYKKSDLKKELENIKPETINGMLFYQGLFESDDVSGLREKIDQIKNQQKKAIVFLASKSNDKVIFLCGVSADLTHLFKAGDLVKEAAKICGGGGGGRPDFAQAGGKDVKKIEMAIKAVMALIET